MNAVIKGFKLFDMNMDYLFPEDIRSFCGILEVEIGPDSEKGSELFSAFVCTPLWFAENVLTQKKQDPTHETFREPKFGTHHLFVHQFDEAAIRGAIERLVMVHGRGEWPKAAARLARHLSWEYDDYDPSDIC